MAINLTHQLKIEYHSNKNKPFSMSLVLRKAEIGCPPTHHIEIKRLN